MTSADVRSKLVESLELDLVGPRPGLGDAEEILPQSPSRWYLAGFLVPIDATSSQKVDEEAPEELESAESGGVDDDEPPERGSAAAKRENPTTPARRAAPGRCSPGDLQKGLPSSPMCRQVATKCSDRRLFSRFSRAQSRTLSVEKATSTGSWTA